MKTGLAVTAIFSVLCFLCGLPPLVVEAVAPPWVGLSTQASWDEVTLDALGGPETIQNYDIALLDPLGDLNLVTVPPPVPIRILLTGVLGWQGTPLTALFKDMKAGSYAIQVRARDQAGNISLWSDKLLVQYDATGPAMPKNVKLKFSLTVTSP